MEQLGQSGPVVAIAGGTRNIGLEIARAILAAGGAVSVCGRDPAQVEVARESLGRPDAAIVTVADCADPDSVAAWASTWESFGRPVDALVYAAGQRVHHRVEDYTPELWRASIEASLSGAFYCTQAFLRQAELPKAGAIVFIGGRSAHKGIPFRSSVVASKLGMVGLARGLALELADRNIRVNVVTPGRIHTDRGAWTSLGDPTLIEHHYKSDVQPDDAPLGPGYPSDIADAVEFLIGPKSRFITGQVLHVNGGTYV
jgi:3-oxoacyl-[acyl-carrier protein] reductase